MALMACPECRREISDQAHACPGCGYPIRAAVTGSQDTTGTVVKTTGAVVGAWLTAPWLARTIAGVVALIGFFIFMIVGALNK